MASDADVRRLRRGVAIWNSWAHQRVSRSGSEIIADLSDVDLNGRDLKFALLRNVNFTGAKLQGADLFGADFAHSKLNGTKLQDACLMGAGLDLADLTNADLTRAMLAWATFRKTRLSGANFTLSQLIETVFANTNLANVIGLETCQHMGPSILDHRTLCESGSLPLPFLRGVGLSDAMIDYLPSLISSPIQHYSCFISYSSQDQSFAERIHADLQNGGVRCWFAPHDMPIGGKILDEIDAAIRLRDKVLLILSAQSISNDWVEDEVTRAFEEERKRNQLVLFPLRIDDAVMKSDEPWAIKLRARHIGDFRRWKDHDSYQVNLKRVLRDLAAK